MKELVKVTAKRGQVGSRENIRAVIIHLLTAAFSFISSRAVLNGNIIPFGLSVLTGVPLYLTPAAAIGAFFGYFIPAIDSGGFRYLACLFAILSVKTLLSKVRVLIEHPIFKGILCFTVVSLTAFVTFKGLPYNLLKQFTEATIAAGGSYFVSRAATALREEPAGLTADELAAMLISIGMLLIGLENITAEGISLGRILGILLILLCSKYGGTFSGAVSGITVSFAAILTGLSPEISAIYAFAGLISGIFSVYGKYVQVITLYLSSIVGLIIIKFTYESVLRIMEVTFGAIVFILLPRSAGRIFGKILAVRPQTVSSGGIKKAVTMRLNMAAGALSDVSDTIEQVSVELGRINAPDFSGVISSIEQDACTGCKLRIHCWETRKTTTVEAILAMTKAVKNGERTPEESAPTEFRGRCMRLSRVGSAVYRNFTDYASATAAERRIEDVRSVVSDQFGGIASMLTDLSLDLEREEKFDHTAALGAASALKTINIHADECSCSIDRYGRMTVKLKVKRTEDLIINKRQIMKIISTVCDRDFDVPNVSEVGGNVFITLSEQTVYGVRFGVHQICASRSMMCGDAYQYFNDGQGHFIIILSDGMGTGGRAAVDGAMASGLMARLLKAGFGYNCSLRILNSSMLFKSTDESLATVDIASIDLYTGEVKLCKAGAAPTVVRRSGRTGKAESSSLPVGILRNIGFDSATIKLKDSDILLMMSDGAVSEGTEWIRKEVEKWQDGDASDLAEHICQCAKRRRSDSHEDDITVLAAILYRM